MRKRVVWGWKEEDWVLETHPCGQAGHRRGGSVGQAGSLDRFWGVSSLPGGGAGLVSKPLDLSKDPGELACPAAPASLLLIAELNMGGWPANKSYSVKVKVCSLGKKEFQSRRRLFYPIILVADGLKSFKNIVKVFKSFCRPAGARPDHNHGHRVAGRREVAVVLRQPVAPVALLLLRRCGERCLRIGARRLLLLSSHLLHLLLVQHCILPVAWQVESSLLEFFARVRKQFPEKEKRIRWWSRRLVDFNLLADV